MMPREPVRKAVPVHKVRWGEQLRARWDSDLVHRLSVPLDAGRRFASTSAPVAASSLAYYAVFSIFPLLGVLVALAGLVAPPERVHVLLVDVLAGVFPVSLDLLSQNVDRFIASRGTIGLVGVIGLLWSASNVFSILIAQVNLAWEQARPRSYWQKRLIGLGMTATIVLGFSALWIATGIFNLLVSVGVGLSIPGAGLIANLVRYALSPLISFAIFFILYRWLPATRVHTYEAALGALVVTLLWELTALGFGWYAGSGLASYNLLYGSLAALAVLMFWFYLNSLILLFGAHLSAAIGRQRNTPNS